MTETQNEASVSDLDISQQLDTWAALPGRRCYITTSGEIGTINSVVDGGYEVRHPNSDVRRVAADAVRPLPNAGERVPLHRDGQLVTGVWLGDQDGGVAVLTGRGDVIAWKPTVADLAAMAVSPHTQDEPANGSSRTVDAMTDTSLLARSLHEAHTRAHRLHDERNERREWIDQLVSAAHEWADENNLCGKFDEFMEEHDLPTRMKPHDVDVTVTISLTVEDVMATDLEQAEEKVTTDDVESKLRGIPFGRMQMEWEVS